MFPFPIPDTPEEARLVLEFVKLGLIIIKIRTYTDHVEFYVRSPEKYNFKSEDGEELDGKKVAIQFKRRLQEFHPNDKIVVKRSPYKNDFDTLDESDGDTAYDEYKRFMMLKYPEGELLL